jgi:hypothetical protein
MTRPELIKAIEDNGAEFKGYKRANGEDLQAAYDALPPKPRPQGRANWGANETPRSCRNPKCKSVRCEAVKSDPLLNPNRTSRYRKCLDCGCGFGTIDVAAQKESTP